MSHWDSCNAIERHPDKVSGAWIFENTRLPVATLFEALKNSPAIDQFLDDFEGVTRQQVVAVLDHEINSLEQHFAQDILKEAAADRQNRTAQAPFCRLRDQRRGGRKPDPARTARTTFT